jgi:hypothetical protein
MGRRLLRRRSRRAAVVILVVGLIGASIWFVASRTSDDEASGPPPGCHVSLDSETYTFGVEQTAHATTIAAVGKRMGMPDHAVTVAIATALQESRLHNLDHGDRDSLGLFQQRPSQGWGSPGEVMTPHYAAGVFFQRLAGVEGWDTLPVTTAAQLVQRSAAPEAYGKWEHQARALAQATTSEIAAGLTCRLDAVPAAESTAPLRLSIARELGSPALEVPVPDARGWTVATWLVAHSADFGITSVTYSGQLWTPSAGRWLAYGGPPDAVVRVSQEPT